MHMIYSKSDLELMVGKDEKILWQSKPYKKCFILEGIFNPMLPFALIWFLFDMGFIIGFTKGIPDNALPSSMGFMVVIFMLLHLMPVWIYLGGVFLVFRRYANTEYIITDKAVYVSSGLFEYKCEMKSFAELARVNIHRGIIDQMLNVGDIVFDSASNSVDIKIEDIPDYQNVFNIVKQLQTDIYSDTMYPNDLRPEENHGYKTKYKGLN